MRTQLGTLSDPWLAGGIVAMFGAVLLSRFIHDNRRALGMGVLLLLWGGYVVYEWRMQLWSATVVAPIRLDLAVIFPVLIVFSTRAWTSVRKSRALTLR